MRIIQPASYSGCLKSRLFQILDILKCQVPYVWNPNFCTRLDHFRLKIILKWSSLVQGRGCMTQFLSCFQRTTYNLQGKFLSGFWHFADFKHPNFGHPLYSLIIAWKLWYNYPLVIVWDKSCHFSVQQNHLLQTFSLFIWPFKNICLISFFLPFYKQCCSTILKPV